METPNLVRKKVKEALIQASISFREDQKEAYKKAIKEENDSNSRWILEKILDNALVAQREKTPLCDDTGIPHLLLEIGKKTQFNGEILNAIHQGVADGLRELPGRPMAVKGGEIERLEQSSGLEDDPGVLFTAPIIIKLVEGDFLRLNILMQGGGPEIRGRTYRVFHQHKLSIIVDEIINWALAEVRKLGCTPCVPAVGIGRTHFEATSMMLQAMIEGKFDFQSPIEKEITERINKSNIGPMGLKGKTTALATFLGVGPQRASGVRIVCLRLGCCFEPRKASVLL